MRIRARARRLLLAGVCGLSLLTVGAGAAQSVGAAEPPCPNEAVREEQHAGYLPDCRAYELVSQADKNQNQIYLGLTPAASFESVLYGVIGGVPGSTAGQSDLIATRTPEGWRSRNILPPREALYAGTYNLLLAGPDLGHVLVSAYDGLVPEKASTREYLLGLDGAGGQTLLHTFPTFNEGGASGVVAAISDDFRRVYAQSAEPIDASQTPGTTDIYDFALSPPRLVSTMPGTVSTPACGVQTQSNGTEGGSGFAEYDTSQHAVSTDGSRLYFVSPGNSCGGPAELYLHQRAGEATTLVSGPPAGAAPDNGVVRFLGATPDGSAVTYVTDTSLTAADTLDGNDEDADVYRYRVASGQNECLTCLVPEAEVSKAHAAVSEDGSTVYFQSARALAPEAEPGAANVYALRAGTLSYVGRTGPYSAVEPVAWNGFEVSADGRFALFASDSPAMDALSGSPGGGFYQYYRYDAGTGHLACVSCPGAGAAAGAVVLSLVTGHPPVTHLRAMSADGSRAFFTTEAALLPEDTNGGPDVYEWHEGRLGLITDGTTVDPGGEFPPLVSTVSPDGRDLLILTTALLGGEARDGALKAYDVRVGGGFAAPPSAPPCAEEACRAAAAPPPAPFTAASATGGAEGNLRAKPRRHRHARHRHRHHRAHRRHHAPNHHRSHSRGGRR